MLFVVLKVLPRLYIYNNAFISTEGWRGRSKISATAALRALGPCYKERHNIMSDTHEKKNIMHCSDKGTPEFISMLDIYNIR